MTHFDGSRFRQVAAVPGKRLTGIFGRDRSHVTVLGEDDLILRWDGSSWSRESGSGNDASGLWESSAGRLWVGAPQGVCANSMAARGARPRRHAYPALRAVHGSSESNIWVVGDNHAVAQWDGTGWRDRSIASATDLVGVWGLDASSLWTVSSDGFVWQWSGSSWTWPIATSRGLRAIAGADSRSILAVGPGELLWFDGSTWKSVAGTLDETLNAVHALDARSFYAAGAAAACTPGTAAATPASPRTLWNTAAPTPCGAATVSTCGPSAGGQDRPLGRLDPDGAEQRHGRQPVCGLGQRRPSRLGQRPERHHPLFRRHALEPAEHRYAAVPTDCAAIAPATSGPSVRTARSSERIKTLPCVTTSDDGGRGQRRRPGVPTRSSRATLLVKAE